MVSYPAFDLLLTVKMQIFVVGLLSFNFGKISCLVKAHLGFGYISLADRHGSSCPL